MEVEFKGRCMGVRLHPRGMIDTHAMIAVMIEDDGAWHDKVTLSSFWLDELIVALQRAKAVMESECVRDCNGGWKFKDGEQT